MTFDQIEAELDRIESVFAENDQNTNAQVIAEARQRLIRFRDELRDEVAQLDLWASNSVSGGWSTHQVEPMRKRADELRRLLIP